MTSIYEFKVTNIPYTDDKNILYLENKQGQKDDIIVIRVKDNDGKVICILNVDATKDGFVRISSDDAKFVPSRLPDTNPLYFNIECDGRFSP